MENRENEHIEFKKSTGELKEGMVSLVSMLNKNGQGTVYFGVKNNGDIVGQQLGALTTQDVSREIKTKIKPRITPQIDILDFDGKRLSVCMWRVRIGRIPLMTGIIFVRMTKTMS